MCESGMHCLVYNNHYYNIVSLTLQEELVCLSSIKMWRIGTESANLTYVATCKEHVTCICKVYCMCVLSVYMHGSAYVYDNENCE